MEEVLFFIKMVSMRERLRPVSLLVISGLPIDCAVLYYASSSSMYYRRGGLILGTTSGEDRGDSTGAVEPSLGGDRVTVIVSTQECVTLLDTRVSRPRPPHRRSTRVHSTRGCTGRTQNCVVMIYTQYYSTE